MRNNRHHPASTDQIQRVKGELCSIIRRRISDYSLDPKGHKVAIIKPKGEHPYLCIIQAEDVEWFWGIRWDSAKLGLEEIKHLTADEAKRVRGNPKTIKLGPDTWGTQTKPPVEYVGVLTRQVKLVDKEICPRVSLDARAQKKERTKGLDRFMRGLQSLLIDYGAHPKL